MVKDLDRQKDRYNWYRTVSNIPEQMELLKQTCKSFKRWFYIEHEPDSEDGKKHLHVMVMYGGSCYLRTAARVLQVPENMVQFCTNHAQNAKYLIHQGYDEKIQYKPEDVCTNFPGLYKSMIIENANDDCHALFTDLILLRKGKINMEQFIELHYVEIQKMPLYQKIKTYEYLEKTSAPT